MSPATRKFLSLIGRHLERGVEQPVPDYTVCVTNEHGYSYFSNLGKVDAMNHSTAVFLINDDVRALYVVYEPDRRDARQPRYLVKTLDSTIDDGDYVIVPSTVGHKLTVAEVVATDAEIDFDSNTPVHWVVQKIDLSTFNDTVEQENEAIAKIKKADFRKRRHNLVETMMSANELKALPLAKRRERGIDD